MKEPRAAFRAMQILLAVLGISALGIAFLIFVLGEQAVYVFEAGFDALSGHAATTGQTISPTIDSELRFYATLWFSYGIVLLWIVRGMVERMRVVPIGAAIFFAGGVGRVLSFLSVGAPHPMFVVLMAIELGLPVVVGGLYLRHKRDTVSQ